MNLFDRYNDLDLDGENLKAAAVALLIAERKFARRRILAWVETAADHIMEEDPSTSKTIQRILKYSPSRALDEMISFFEGEYFPLEKALED
jgi:hypothetical protein